MIIAPPVPSTDWAYFLDVDGTLIDIAQTPDEVLVDHDLLRLIESLHALSNGAVALVSGRALIDLDALLGMPHLAENLEAGLDAMGIDVACEEEDFL